MNQVTGKHLTYMVRLGLCCMAVASLFCCQSAAAQDCDITPSEYWKNTIDFPDEPFRVCGDSDARPDWVKFTIALCDPENVYYQDSNAYTFHYDFATELLDPFVGMTQQEYDDVTLYEQGQEAVLGAVIMPASWIWPLRPQINEYGIQLVRHDPYTPQEIVDLFHQVKDTVNADPEVQAFYFPTYEQYEVAYDNLAFLEQNGVLVSSPARWADGNACYSEGWAVGTLKYVEADDIEDAYQSGELLPTDILITDAVPAEMPYLAGIMTLSPATPNSHVAILANSYGIPFVHWALQEDAEQAMALVGSQIAFTAYEDWGYCDARVIEIGSILTPTQIAEILELKALPPLDIEPTEPLGAYSAPTDGLELSDVKYFGGKASNFGFLRRAIPDDSPVAGAFSFDLFNGFMDQDLEELGMSLRAYIAEILDGHSWPPDFGALADDLDDIRDLIKDDDDTHFSPELQAAILSALQQPGYGFDPFKKIRFRSSTNVEDVDQFTGAGLYDSKSGCLADDLDGDDVGPSWCDPGQEDERGVFRAIRRVLASFYLDNAYVERLRWDVDESDVGMAVLFHHSFPDPIELANGVATMHRHSPTYGEIYFVSQPGAVSVSNPEGGAIPEEVRVGYWNTTFYTEVQRYSSLLVLGETVLELPDEYEAFAGMMREVATDYAAAIGEESFILDFEYKKVAPGGGVLPEGGLVIKQVRKIPEPDDTETITPFLINQPVEYCTYQGEYGDVFANHRLKSRWQLTTENQWLTEERLREAPVYDDLVIEYTDGCWTRWLEGPMESFFRFRHEYDDEGTPYVGTVDRWVVTGLPNNRQFTLRTDRAGELVSPAESPLVTISDLGMPNSFFRYNELALTIKYDEEVPAYTWQGLEYRREETALLVPCPTAEDTDLVQERSFTDDWGHVTIDTSFYWPYGSAPAGYTAPLHRWVETTIRGLTSEPIVLHDWYAQSYRPHHHNFGEEFIFEPRLDPMVPDASLAELAEQGIDIIHVINSFQPTVTVNFLADDDCGHTLCADNSDCGYPEYGLYCEKAVGDCDGDGVCIDMPEICPDVWDPVCGCDGVTYGNACEAAAAGVSVDHEGPCEQVCGGIAGIECRASDEYCHFPDGTCDIADRMGVCEVVPEACYEIVDPVCGCDGVTYTNDCFAAMARVSIDHEGPCEQVCGGIAGIECRASDEYCHFPDGTCEIADRMGVCEVVPEACYEIVDPVCGCDGVTYTNDCFAAMARVSIDHEGPCEQICGGIAGIPCEDEGDYCNLGIGHCCCDYTGICAPMPDPSECTHELSPVCGCDGTTYQSACLAAVAGVSIDHLGPCGQVCGGFAGIPCENEDEFCLLPDGHCCCDFTGVCTPVPHACPRVVDPVCGCDGRTYVNRCEAWRQEQSVDYEGPCQKTGACCLPDGTCEDTIEEKCKGACGTFYGTGSVCDITVITPNALSASDRQTTSAVGLTELTSADRRPIVIRRCPEMITGACCLDNGTCLERTKCECVELDAGDYQGDGTWCEEVDCGEERCGGIAGLTCSDPDDFCLFPEETCGDGDIMGVCTPKPDGCLLPVIDWVCGCDGESYVYDCFAYKAGQSIRHRGMCDNSTSISAR